MPILQPVVGREWAKIPSCSHLWDPQCLVLRGLPHQPQALHCNVLVLYAPSVGTFLTVASPVLVPIVILIRMESLSFPIFKRSFILENASNLYIPSLQLSLPLLFHNIYIKSATGI